MSHSPPRFGSPLSLPQPNRRTVLRLGLAGLASWLACNALPTRASAQQGMATAQRGRVKACVLLWMNGGPSQLDTFDPKPGTPNAGPFKAIPTRAPSISLCEHFPQLATQAHHLAIVRSMTSREGNHERAQYYMHTGYAPTPTVTHPSFGAWVSHETGQPEAELPNFISIRGPSFGAGILGVEHGPFVIADPSQPPQNIAFARNVEEIRFGRRLAALRSLDDPFQSEMHDGKVNGKQSMYAKATRLMRSSKLRSFDISEEPIAIRHSYGDTDFGKGCLLARRLIESGVPFVEVLLDGWDTHQDNFNRTKKLMDTLDPAMATLTRELSERGLLDSTLVLCMGEFGRTPKINDKEGRDHFPQVGSAVLAGGGIRGGSVYGQTDADGAKIVDKPVPVPDLFATLATLFGIPTDTSVKSPLGRPIAISDKGIPLNALLL